MDEQAEYAPERVPGDDEGPASLVFDADEAAKAAGEDAAPEVEQDEPAEPGSPTADLEASVKAAADEAWLTAAQYAQAVADAEVAASAQASPAEPQADTQTS